MGLSFQNFAHGMNSLQPTYSSLYTDYLSHLKNDGVV
jgi:hypothetical protein